MASRRRPHRTAASPIGILVSMAGSAVGPTLLTTGELEAEIGVLLRYEVVDRATGVPIGKARRGTLWDLDNRPLVRLVGRDEHGSGIVE
jgi:hypothetical protein